MGGYGIAPVASGWQRPVHHSSPFVRVGTRERAVGLVDLVRLARSKAAEPHRSVRIPDDQVQDATASPLPAFEPGACYLEVRLAQMHLRDRRELWRGFLPLS